MAIELIILAGAILGAFAVILTFQVRKQLIEKQINITDLDEVVKALFELDLDKTFYAKVVIGTGIGAFGAFASMSALVSGAPTNGDNLALIAYGFTWGFGGNGILYILKMLPENLITVMNLNTQVKTQKAEIETLKLQNTVLSQQHALLTKQQQEPLSTEIPKS